MTTLAVAAAVLAAAYALPRILSAKQFERVASALFTAAESFGFLVLLLVTFLLTVAFWPAAVVFLLFVLTVK